MRYFALNLSGGVRERSEGEGWWGWGGGRLSSPELLWCLFTRSVLGPVQHLWSRLASSGILMFCKLGCKIWKALGHSPGRFALAESRSPLLRHAVPASKEAANFAPQLIKQWAPLLEQSLFISTFTAFESMLVHRHQSNIACNCNGRWWFADWLNAQ